MSLPFYAGHGQHSLTSSSASTPQPHQQQHHRSRRSRAAAAAAAAQASASAGLYGHSAHFGVVNPTHAPFRGSLTLKHVVVDTPAMAAFRTRFEAAVSFDLDDDLEFCPALLTDEDIVSIHSSPSSDRSSLSSLSPEHSPLQQQIQPMAHVSNLSLAGNNASTASYLASQAYQPTPSPSTYSSGSYFAPISPMKNNSLAAAAAAAARSRNAIPIVDPSTGMRMPSPPNSVSPARLPFGRPRW